MGWSEGGDMGKGEGGTVYWWTLMLNNKRFLNCPGGQENPLGISFFDTTSLGHMGRGGGRYRSQTEI